jgi:hypothetical protein
MLPPHQDTRPLSTTLNTPQMVQASPTLIPTPQAVDHHHMLKELNHLLPHQVDTVHTPKRKFHQELKPYQPQAILPQMARSPTTPPPPHQEDNHTKPTQPSIPQVDHQSHTYLEPPAMEDKLLQPQFHQASAHTSHPPSLYQTAKVETTITHT